MKQIEIETEQEELKADIEEYEDLLETPDGRNEKRIEKISGWYEEIIEQYGEDRDGSEHSHRHTKIRHEELEIDLTDLREESPATVLEYPNDYVRRESDHKGTGDVSPAPRRLIQTTSLQRCLVFDRAGKVYDILVSDVPDDTRDEKGAPIQQVNNNIESLAGIVPGNCAEVLLFTRNGYVKRMEIDGDDDFEDIRPSGIKCIDFKEDDNEVVSVVRVRDGCDAIAVATNGKGIRFDLSDVRPMSRGARGVTAKKGDALAGGVVASDDECLLLSGPETCGAVDVSDIEPQNRGGKGRYVIKPGNDNELDYVGVSDYPVAAVDGEAEDFTSRSKIGGRGARDSIDYFVVVEDWDDDSS